MVFFEKRAWKITEWTLRPFGKSLGDLHIKNGIGQAKKGPEDLFSIILGKRPTGQTAVIEGVLS